MTSTRSTSTDARAGPALGALLRRWRAERGRSQLELALDMGISQRHVSFVESGRSAPSRAMLLGMARALDVPFRERNALLLAAGFAPAYADEAWNSTEMRAVHRALRRMLKQHEPFPALVMDRYWNVLETNDAAPRFFGRFVDLSRHPRPRNLLRLVFDPDGLRPHIDRWDTVARALFDRIRRESTGGVVDEKMAGLVAELRASAGTDVDAGPVEGSGTAPVIPIGFVAEGRTLDYFSMVATVGTPQTISAQELRLECMFPADDATEAWHLETFATAAAGASR